MSTVGRRRLGLVVVLAVTLVLAAAVLDRVLGTLFFAVTVAYVLYPLHRRLRALGVSGPLASLVLMVCGTGGIALVLLPLVTLVYRRRTEFVAFVAQLPDVLTVSVGSVEYTVETVAVDAFIRTSLLALARRTAAALPSLTFKAVLFATVVYALLLAPTVVGYVVTDVVPASFHDVVRSFDARIRQTLYAIYGLQVLMGVLAFLVGFVLFTALGYDVAFSLAVIAGLLQFVPLFGPIVLVLLLGAYELALADPAQGIVVIALGTVLFPVLLDVVVRPKLARRTGALPPSLYLTGFVGGILSVGAIGFVAGPLVVALVVEAAELVAADSSR